MLQKLRLFGPICIVIAALLWALDGVLRRGLYHLPPLTIVLLEHVVGLLILMPFAFPFARKHPISKKDWILVIIIALFSGLLGTLFFTKALQAVQFIPFSVVFLLQKLQPLFAIFFAWIVLKEVPSRRYIPWALLALVSAYFVTFPNGVVNLETGSGTIMGALFALLAAFLWGSSTAFSKKLLQEVPTTLATFLRFTLTTVFAFGALILFGDVSSLGGISTHDILFLVAIALSTGMVALQIYYKGLSTTKVHIATILELTFPLIAVCIDIFFYKTFLLPSQYIAAAVLLFAMYQVVKVSQAKKTESVS